MFLTVLCLQEEYEHAIVEDLKSLDIKADVVTHTSDWFEKTMELCTQMIKEGTAYTDNTEQAQMRQERMDGIASKCRDQSVEENLRRWEEMKLGTDFGKTCCVRAKMSVDAKNKALRDPVMYRCNEIPHARTGYAHRPYSAVFSNRSAAPSTRCTRRTTLLAPWWTRSRA